MTFVLVGFQQSMSDSLLCSIVILLSSILGILLLAHSHFPYQVSRCIENSVGINADSVRHECVCFQLLSRS